jgi:hypothetical protein
MSVLVDTASSAKFVCAGTVPEQLLELWKAQIGELYVMVLIRWQFQELLRKTGVQSGGLTTMRRATRHKRPEPSKAMRSLVREFYSIDAAAPTYSWIERVPSGWPVRNGVKGNQSSYSQLSNL